MTTTLSMVPVAQIRPNKANPRAEFDDERMGELIESVKRHGIITPLTLSRDGEGRYAIIAGERRYRAAKAAKLREVPAQVREVEGDALTLAVAENVIRADLSPLEEARAYRRLVDDHGDAAKVASLVGRSERLVSERLDLLRLPERAQELLAARRLPLACAPALVNIGEGEPLLADLAAVWLAERPQDAASFPADPGEVVDDVLAAEWTDDDGKALHPVAYSVGGYHGPILRARRGARGHARGRPGEARRARGGGRGGLWRVAGDLARLRLRLGGPRARGAPRPGVLRPQRRRRRRRAGVRLLLELAGANGRGDHRYVTDPEWVADRLVQKIAAHVAAEAERTRRGGENRGQAVEGDDAEKQSRREQRERDYAERVGARARNLDLGAALARWEPKLDTDAAKLLGSLVLLHYGKSAAWAHRLCVEQPTTTNKQGKATVRYPRGAPAEKQAHEAALAALMRTRTPEAAVAVVLRLLVAQRLADTAGFPEPTAKGSTSHTSFPARRSSTSLPGGLRRSRSSSGSPRLRPSGRSARRHGRPSRRRGSRSNARSSQEAKQSAANAVYA